MNNGAWPATVDERCSPTYPTRLPLGLAFFAIQETGLRIGQLPLLKRRRVHSHGELQSTFELAGWVWISVMADSSLQRDVLHCNAACRGCVSTAVAPQFCTVLSCTDCAQLAMHTADVHTVATSAAKVLVPKRDHGHTAIITVTCTCDVRRHASSQAPCSLLSLLRSPKRALYRWRWEYRRRCARYRHRLRH